MCCPLVRGHNPIFCRLKYISWGHGLCGPMRPAMFGSWGHAAQLWRRAAARTRTQPPLGSHIEGWSK